jgi:hypothetical protein
MDCNEHNQTSFIPCKVVLAFKYRPMEIYGGSGVKPHTLSTSVLYGGMWSASRSGRFSPSTHWIGGTGPKYCTWEYNAAVHVVAAADGILGAVRPLVNAVRRYKITSQSLYGVVVLIVVW